MALAYPDGSQPVYVDHGSDASIDDLVAATLLYVIDLPASPTFASDRRLLAKPAGGGLAIRMTDTSGNIRIFRNGDGTGGVDITTNDAPLTVSATNFIAFTWETNKATNTAHIYTGTKSAKMTESSYGSEFYGAGASTGDAASNLMVGGNQAGAVTLVGNYSVFGYVAREMTLEELIHWQFNPEYVPPDARIYCHYGIHGSGGVGTQLDRSPSQNHGTITGSLTKAAHAPIKVFQRPREIVRPTTIPFLYTGPAANGDDTTQIGTTSFVTTSPLHIEANASSSFRYSAMRCSLSGVNQGDTINKAVLWGYFATSSRRSIRCEVIGEKVATPAVFTGAASEITNRLSANPTTAEVTWYEPTGKVGWQSIDVTSVVQELVDQGTWPDDGNIVLFLDPSAYTSGEFGWIDSYESSTASQVWYLQTWVEAEDVIFQDDLIGGGTLLESWTPDIGTSWTRVWTQSTQSFQVIGTGVRANQNAGDVGFIYTADATYPSADYHIEFTFVQTYDTLTPLYALLRVQDQENMYAVRIVDGTTACQIYKKVSGSWTALGSAFDSPADGSIVKFSVIGTSLRVYDDGVEIASATDSDITAAGKAGMAHGGGAELVLSTDDIRAVEMFHTLTVVNRGAASSTVTFAAAPAGTTTTPDTAALTAVVGFSAAAAGATTTPDIATLGKNIPFVAATAGDTTTPDTVTLDVGGTVTFAAASAGVTTTPDTVYLLVLTRSGELIFGEQTPLSGEVPTSWATWSDGAGGAPTISGDPDWGKLELATSEEGRSRVYNMGSSVNRYWTISENDYGTGQGSATLQIRGDTSPFAQDDVTPSWSNYTAPVKQNWQYVQIRELA